MKLFLQPRRIFRLHIVRAAQLRGQSSITESGSARILPCRRRKTAPWTLSITLARRGRRGSSPARAPRRGRSRSRRPGRARPAASFPKSGNDWALAGRLLAASPSAPAASTLHSVEAVVPRPRAGRTARRSRPNRRRGAAAAAADGAAAPPRARSHLRRPSRAAAPTRGRRLAAARARAPEHTHYRMRAPSRRNLSHMDKTQRAGDPRHPPARARRWPASAVCVGGRVAPARSRQSAPHVLPRLPRRRGACSRAAPPERGPRVAHGREPGRRRRRSQHRSRSRSRPSCPGSPRPPRRAHAHCGGGARSSARCRRRPRAARERGGFSFIAPTCPRRGVGPRRARVGVARELQARAAAAAGCRCTARAASAHLERAVAQRRSRSRSACRRSRRSAADASTPRRTPAAKISAGTGYSPAFAANASREGRDVPPASAGYSRRARAPRDVEVRDVPRRARAPPSARRRTCRHTARSAEPRARERERRGIPPRAGAPSTPSASGRARARVVDASPRRPRRGAREGGERASEAGTASNRRRAARARPSPRPSRP